MIELERICKTYHPGTVNELRLLRDFSLSVPDGQFVSVVGSNGSGKTTLLNLICGSVPADAGRICIGGRDVTRMRAHKRARQISCVFQDPALGACASLTILENLSLADRKGRAYNLLPGTDQKRIPFYRDLLAPLGLGLEQKLHVQAGALSGGQRQALALVMATLTPIDILILDEHTAALDPKTAQTIMHLTGQLVREKRLCTVMVTHNLRLAE